MRTVPPNNATSNLEGNPMKHEIKLHDHSDIVLPEKGEPRVVGKVVLNHLEEQMTEQEYTEVFDADPVSGAKAVAAAFGVIFGSFKGQAIPPSMMSQGQLPQTLNVGTQENIYQTSFGQFSESSLHDEQLLGIDTIVRMATDAGVVVPSPYGEHHRDEILRAAIATSTSRSENPNPNWFRVVGKLQDRIQVPFGLVTISKPDGQKFGMAHIGTTDEDGSPYKGRLRVKVVTTVSNRHIVNDLWVEIQNQLSNDSVFKGTLVNYNQLTKGTGRCDYFDQPDPELVHRLVYSDDQETLIKGLLLYRIVFRDKIKRVAPHLAKATVLQPGIYGTGKTSTQMIVAWFALTQGWTCIKYMPSRGATKQEFGEMLEFAEQHSPALLMIEDIETIIDPADRAAFKNLLDDLDGANSKSFDSISMMTTNHEGEIHGSIVRRLEGVIPFEGLDENGVRKMIKKSAGKHWVGYEGEESLRSTIYDIPFDSPVSDDMGLDEIVDLLVRISEKVQDEHGKTVKTGVPHWLVSLVVKRSMIFALPQPGDDMFISQVEMVAAAKTLVPQFSMYTANEDESSDVAMNEMYLSRMIVSQLVETLESKALVK